MGKMAADVTDLKAGKTVSKPIYNHITGELDPYEEVPATPIVIFEGLHPLYDSRVNAALDLSIYLDITDEVKFAWKAQRDIAERGATMEDVQKAIDARKPDFKAYVEPDGSGKFLKVKFIQRKDCAALESAYLMDEGSTSSRRSSTSRARCATRAPSSTASSPSRSSRTRTRPARTTAPASCRPSAPSRSARSTRSSPSRLL